MDDRYNQARGIAAVWTAMCIALGAFVAWQILDLREGTHAVDTAGEGLERTADSLGQLEDLPVVGDRAADAADSIEDAGGEARQAANDMRSTITLLALVTGFAIAILPTIPLLLVVWITRPVGRERAP